MHLRYSEKVNVVVNELVHIEVVLTNDGKGTYILMSSIHYTQACPYLGILSIEISIIGCLIGICNHCIDGIQLDREEKQEARNTNI